MNYVDGFGRGGRFGVQAPAVPDFAAPNFTKPPRTKPTGGVVGDEDYPAPGMTVTTAPVTGRYRRDQRRATEDIRNAGFLEARAARFAAPQMTQPQTPPNEGLSPILAQSAPGYVPPVTYDGNGANRNNRIDAGAKAKARQDYMDTPPAPYRERERQAALDSVAAATGQPAGTFFDGKGPVNMAKPDPNAAPPMPGPLNMTGYMKPEDQAAWDARNKAQRENNAAIAKAQGYPRGATPPPDPARLAAAAAAKRANADMTMAPYSGNNLNQNRELAQQRANDNSAVAEGVANSAGAQRDDFVRIEFENKQLRDRIQELEKMLNPKLGSGKVLPGTVVNSQIDEQLGDMQSRYAYTVSQDGKYKDELKAKIDDLTAAGAKPPKPIPQQATGEPQVDAQALIEEAREALRRGADPAAVRRRLAEMGINEPGF